MPSSRVTAAHARDARQRHHDYAGPVKVNGVEGTGTYTPPRSARSLRDGGFIGEHDTELCLMKSEWPAYTSRKQLEGLPVHLSLNGTWVAFNVAGVTDMRISAEWKLQLHAGVA